MIHERGEHLVQHKYLVLCFFRALENGRCVVALDLLRIPIQVSICAAVVVHLRAWKGLEYRDLGEVSARAPVQGYRVHHVLLGLARQSNHVERGDLDTLALE